MFLFTARAGQGQNAMPIQLGDRREIFFDDFLIEKMTGVSLRMHAPHNEGPVLYFDQPWKGQFSAYSTIIRDGNVYRLYYRGIPEAGRDGDNTEVTCYSESPDGIKWVKPKLKIYNIRGSLDNNVLLANAAPADCSDAILMSTRGGDNYQCTFMELFLRPGIGLQNWVSRSNYPALMWYKPALPKCLCM